MAKRYIPRWLYTEATVYRGGIEDDDLVTLGNMWIKVPPGSLRNDTIWPMQLEYLCVAGIPTSSNLPALDVEQTTGACGIGGRLLAEIGISQEGDINVVPAELNTVFSRTEKARLQSQRVNWGVTCHFRHPFRLSRDSGFSVSYRKRPDLLLGPTGVEDPSVFPDGEQQGWTDNSGILFRGVDVVTGKAVILGGNNENKQIHTVGEIMYDSADLTNNGRHDVDIYSMSMSNWYASKYASQMYYSAAAGVHEAYLVNPIIGERWMPGCTEIPLACLAPLSVEGFMCGVPTAGSAASNQYRRDIGPHTFWFDRKTYLHRRQEIALRLAINTLYYNQPVHVAVFGYLEVE